MLALAQSASVERADYVPREKANWSTTAVNLEAATAIGRPACWLSDRSVLDPMKGVKTQERAAAGKLL